MATDREPQMQAPADLAAHARSDSGALLSLDEAHRPRRRPDAGAGQARLRPGQIIHLMGRVLDTRASRWPARVDIWQANAHGRYVHPSDYNPPRSTRTSRASASDHRPEGRYRFKTVKPDGYPTHIPGWKRPPHIHFDVTGSMDKLITQMYFEGDPLNERTACCKAPGRQERLIARMLPPTRDVEPDACWRSGTSSSRAGRRRLGRASAMTQHKFELPPRIVLGLRFA